MFVTHLQAAKDLEEEQESGKESDDDQSGSTLSLANTLKYLKENAPSLEPPKKRMFGVALDPSEYPKHEGM